MDRLTKKIKNPQYSNNYELLCAHEYHAINKLGELEDLAEKIGCPLDVLFRALTDGVWVEVSPIDINFENPETMYLEDFVSLEKKLDGTLCLNARDYVDELELKDYKKTWWLKKDKSE